MTVESVFKSRTVKEIYDEIRQVYLSDNRPWILGFSGGKDSTCMVQLVWHAISNLPEEKRQKKLDHLQNLINKWQRKQKTANTFIRKYTKKVKYHTKK